MQQLDFEDISIELERKSIKHIYLRVYADGRVKISAPKRMPLRTVSAFAVSRLNWIRRKQEVLQKRKKENPKTYSTNEIHSFKGEKYVLAVIEHRTKPKVLLKANKIELYVKAEASAEKRKQVLDSWYRAEMQSVIPDLVEKWERVIGVKSNEVRIKKMRTKWGTCNTRAKRIWLNLELIKRPVVCLEYIIVHELVHLLERSHNARFTNYMNLFMPQWRLYQKELESGF